MSKLIYGTENTIYKENKSCDRLTDRRSPSVGPVVPTGHKGVLVAKCPLANCLLANCLVRNNLPSSDKA